MIPRRQQQQTQQQHQQHEEQRQSQEEQQPQPEKEQQEAIFNQKILRDARFLLVLLGIYIACPLIFALAYRLSAREVEGHHIFKL